MTEQLRIIISAEVEKLKNGLSSAKKEVKDAVAQIKKENGGFIDSFNKAGEASKKVLTTVGKGVGLAVTAITGLSVATAEYRRNQALLTSSFETAGGTAADAAKTYQELYRVLGDDGQATEAAQHIAKLTTEEKALSEWTNICQGVYATFSASLPIEGLTEAANETAKTAKVTGVLADAINWSSLTAEQAQVAFGNNSEALEAYTTALSEGETQEDAFNAALAACTTEAEREALIRGTLNSMYSEAAANYEKNAAAILAENEANAKLTAQFAKLSEAFAPILTAFKSFAADALAQVTPHIENLAAAALPALQSILTAVADALGVVIGWIANNWELISTIGTVILAVASAFAVMNAAVGVANAVMTVLSMNPIVLAIAALIAIITLCVIYWDEIKAAAQVAWEAVCAAWEGASEWFASVWENIVAVFTPVAEWFGNLFASAWALIQEAWAAVSEWFTNLWANIQAVFAVVGEVLSGFFSTAWTLIQAAWSVVVAWFQGIWDGVAAIFSVVGDVLSGNFSSAWEGIKNAFSSFTSHFRNIWTAVQAVFSSVGAFFNSKFSDAWAKIKNVFAPVSTFFTNLWNSIVNIFTSVGDAVGGAISGVVNKAINTVVGSAVNIINSFISMINGAISIINAIPGVSISSLSMLSVPAMATGGIVDSATLAVVGEAGTEAVMPLENNLEWLDKLAGMLNERMGGGNGQPIVLNVDGKRFAEISCQSINDLTRQRGNIPLVMY